MLPAKTAGGTAKGTAYPDTSAATGFGQSQVCASQVDCPRDNSVIVGGAVGGVLGTALLSCCGVIALLLSRRPKPVQKSKFSCGPGHDGMKLTAAGVSDLDSLKGANVAVSPGGPPRELSAARAIFEVPANAVSFLPILSSGIRARTDTA